MLLLYVVSTLNDGAKLGMLLGLQCLLGFDWSLLRVAHLLDADLFNDAIQIHFRTTVASLIRVSYDISYCISLTLCGRARLSHLAVDINWSHQVCLLPRL